MYVCALPDFKLKKVYEIALSLPLDETLCLRAAEISAGGVQGPGAGWTGVFYSNVLPAFLPGPLPSC